MLEQFEKETIINFNTQDKMASIFTYSKVWQRHLEGKLGLVPIMDNGHGGREYAIDKSRIKPPRASRKLSEKTRKALRDARDKRKSIVVTKKSRDKAQRVGKLSERGGYG